MIDLAYGGESMSLTISVPTMRPRASAVTGTVTGASRFVRLRTISIAAGTSSMIPDRVSEPTLQDPPGASASKRLMLRYNQGEVSPIWLEEQKGLLYCGRRLLLVGRSCRS